jgi:hypothetical protein
MTDHDKNQLLEELFGDDELNHLRQTSLLRCLQELRRRRRRGLAARVSMMALPVLLLAATVFYPRFQPPSKVTAPTSMAYSSTAKSKVEYITTDQLFALFPNRQMALVGKPDHQQLIFLDDQPATDNQ